MGVQGSGYRVRGFRVESEAEGSRGLGLGA